MEKKLLPSSFAGEIVESLKTNLNSAIGTKAMKLMRTFAFICIILLNALVAASQGKGESIDSLKRLYKLAKEDTARALLMMQLSNAYTRLNPDTALAYSVEGLKLSQKIKYKKGEYYNRAAMARSWWSTGNYSAGVQILLPKLKEIESINDYDLMMAAYSALADCYRDLGSYDQALGYLLKSAKPIRIDGKPYRIFYAALASNYLGKKRPDSAQYYIKKAFLYPADPNLEGWPLYIRAQTYAEVGKYDTALSSYRLSIQKFTNENNLKDLTSVFNSMASLFRSIGSNDSALHYSHKALSVALPRKFAKEAMEAFLQISSSYEQVNTDSALHYYKLAIAAKDSLYDQEKQRQLFIYQFNEQLREQQIENAQSEFRSRVKIYVLLATAILFLLIGLFLLRNNRQTQKANELLHYQKRETEEALKKVKATQTQLIHAEKMASLGELTAGIAHEIQNPLNFVNNFSDLNKELADELMGELNTGNSNEAKEIASAIRENAEKISVHGKRADAIVKGMLQHSRSGAGKKEPTDINALADAYLRLSYQGLRAKEKSFNASIKTDFDTCLGKIDVVPQDIGRVFLNLFNNAFYSVNQKSMQTGDGYQPTLVVMTQKADGKVIIKVRDNGNGIPQKIIDKIYQPFFTTKPTGEGTGLGLSLSYDIITKGHGGELRVNTEENEFAEFEIVIPC